eukprot:2394797-Pyramimonas_sp.AAC.1
MFTYMFLPPPGHPQIVGRENRKGKSLLVTSAVNQEGREHIPAVRTNRRRAESIFPPFEPIEFPGGGRLA